MRKTLFTIFCLLLLLQTVSGQAKRRIIGSAGGAARIEELGQAVFLALKQNRPEDLSNYFPQEKDLKVLKNRSSEDMRAVLENNTPESIKLNFTRDFNQIIEQATGNGLNLSEWQLSSTNVTQIDRKNRQFYRVQLTLTNLRGAESQVLFEAFKTRWRYFLFRQMLLKPAI